MFVRVAVDRERQQVLADASVVEQRVALAGRAVAGNRGALAGASNEELKQFIPGGTNHCSETAVPLEGVQTRGGFVGQHLGDALAWCGGRLRGH